MMLLTALLALLAQAPEPPRPHCDASNSIVTTIPGIQAEPARFIGRCVTVSGAVSGRRLYTGREGIYLVSRAWEARAGDSPDFRHRLGIDGQTMRGLARHPSWTTVTGWLDSCELRAERARRRPLAPGEIRIPSLGGYCHWEGGPVLVPSDYSLRELRYDRLVGEEARQLYGNLAPMPAVWPFRRQMEVMAGDFLAALRSADREALEALYDDQIGREDLSYLIDDPASPFAELRGSAPSQTAHFVGMAPDGSLLDRDEPDATICFCRSGDCSNKWPIARFDAENAPERPFACIRVVPRDWVTRGFGLDTMTRGGWLYEPAATAFRR
jgi:hypothetical protein